MNWLLSNELFKMKKHTHAKGDKRSHATLRCCWKGKVLLLTCIKASKRKGHGSTMNLATMIETTNA